MRAVPLLDDFELATEPDALERLVDEACMSVVEAAVDAGFACAHADEVLARIRGEP
jgi:hypothetical protein